MLCCLPDSVHQHTDGIGWEQPQPYIGAAYDAVSSLKNNFWGPVLQGAKQKPAYARLHNVLQQDIAAKEDDSIEQEALSDFGLQNSS